VKWSEERTHARRLEQEHTEGTETKMTNGLSISVSSVLSCKNQHCENQTHRPPDWNCEQEQTEEIEKYAI